MKTFINPFNGHTMVSIDGKNYYVIKGKIFHRITLYELLLLMSNSNTKKQTQIIYEQKGGE